MARETLRAWQEKNHPWLQLSDVHRETTEHIRVTVIPFYMGCRVSVFAALPPWFFCLGCKGKLKGDFCTGYVGGLKGNRCRGYRGMLKGNHCIRYKGNLKGNCYME